MLFIIGNGFDLAMGLKTSYSDFLNWYLEQKEEPEDRRIYEFKENIRNDIAKSINSWADLEIKLGEYTNQYRKEEAQDFLDVYWDMKSQLNVYIQNQELKFDLSNSAVLIETFSNFLLEFYSKLRPTDQVHFRTILAEQSYSVHYHFLSYNYTHTLDNCLAVLPNPLRTRSRGGSLYKDIIGTVLHIHGETNKSPLFGVDSENQILNEAFRNEKSILRALVKPRLIEEWRDSTSQKAMELINGNGIICLFGVSIGNSDISWWVKLGAWLKKDANRKLVIFWYSHEELSSVHFDKRLTQMDNVVNHFARQSGLSDDDFAKVENQIFVHIYTDIFNLKLVPAEAIIDEAEALEASAPAH